VGLVILHEQCYGFINVMCNRTRKISMCSGLVVHMWLTTITLYTTLNRMFSMTHDLELSNTIIVYNASHFVSTKVESVVWRL
jgi:hypothetical protein